MNNLNKRRKIFNYIIIAILIIYNVILKFTVLNTYTDQKPVISCVFLILLFLLSVGMYGFAESRTTPLKKKIIKQVLVIVILGIGITYAIGALVGFTKNGLVYEPLAVIKNILVPIIIVVFTELFRYNFIRANKNEFVTIVFVMLLLCILEMQMSVVVFSYFNFEKVFIFITTLVIPILMKNIVLSYLAYEVDYKPCLIYSLILKLYVFIIPYLPNLGDYLTSMFGLCLPTIIFIYASSSIEEYEEGIGTKYLKRGFRLLDIPIYAFIIIVIALISRAFPVFTIGVGSESMTGAINKCDAVIAYKVDEEKINVGDVIVFQTFDKILIHRVVEIEEIDGVKYYRTKGDVNGSRDNIDVTKDKIYGKVKFRIPYIAYPSVWVSEKLK